MRGGLAALLSLLTTNVPAQMVVQEWVQRFNGSGNHSDQPVAIAVDGSGNVIVTGFSYGNSSGYDYATIKYSNRGVALWTNRYTGIGSSEDKPTAMAVDSNDDVVVTGWLGTGSGSSYATIKYSGAGVPLWTNRYNSPWSWADWAAAIAVDHFDNVFVTGRSGAEDFYLYFRYDYATIKYSSTGVPLWTNCFNGPANGQDYATAAGVDGTGSVFVTGYSAIGGSLNYATIKYSGEGMPLWTNRYGQSAVARDLAVDGNGSVFVTGYSSGSEVDYATIAYSNTGEPLWTNRYNGPENRDDRATAVVLDTAGNVFVTGRSYSFNSADDYVTVKYSSTGVPLWTNRYSWPGNSPDDANALAVDNSGNVCVTGYSRGDGDSHDIATIKYSGAGVPLWTNRYDGPGNGDDRASALAVDGSGNVYVTGYSIGGGTDYDYVTIRYSNVKPMLTIGCTTTNTLAITWPSLASDFSLQQNPDAATTNWTQVGTTPVDDGTNKTVIVDPLDGSRFYRLVSP